jgi:hypothetical protein
MDAEYGIRSEGIRPNNKPRDSVSDWRRERVVLYISNIEDLVDPEVFIASTRQRLPQTMKILREPLLAFAREPLPYTYDSVAWDESGSLAKIELASAHRV